MTIDENGVEIRKYKTDDGVIEIRRVKKGDEDIIEEKIEEKIDDKNNEVKVTIDRKDDE